MAWFLRLLDTYALGVLGRAVDARTSAGPSQQKARTTISTAPTAATATCVPSSPSPWATLAAMALRRAAAPTPRSHRAEVEFAWARSGGGALVRRQAGSQRRHPAPNSTWPVDPSDRNWHRQAAGSPAPRASAEPCPGTTPPASAGGTANSQRRLSSPVSRIRTLLVATSSRASCLMSVRSPRRQPAGRRPDGRWRLHRQRRRERRGQLPDPRQQRRRRNPGEGLQRRRHHPSDRHHSRVG